MDLADSLMHELTVFTCQVSQNAGSQSAYDNSRVHAASEMV